jgi:hypothetical protein
VPLSHGTAGLSCYLAHDDVPAATDGDDISIHTTKEMEKYDVNLLERVGLDEELPIILRTIGWGELYDEPCLGSRFLTLEFL